MARVNAGGAPVPRRPCGLECDLFDGNREPSDQPRNLVQQLGILRLKGLRKPGEALVIAHRGYLAWNDRRHRPHESGQQIWHRITSNGSNRRGRAWSGIKSFWRSVRGAGKPLARPVRCRIAFVGSRKWAKNHCSAERFGPFLIPSRSCLFRPLQASEALLYAPRRERPFAYSSVAQR